MACKEKELKSAEQGDAPATEDWEAIDSAFRSLLGAVAGEAAEAIEDTPDYESFYAALTSISDGKQVEEKHRSVKKWVLDMLEASRAFAKAAPHLLEKLEPEEVGSKRKRALAEHSHADAGDALAGFLSAVVGESTALEMIQQEHEDYQAAMQSLDDRDNADSDTKEQAKAYISQIMSAYKKFEPVAKDAMANL